MLTAGKVRLSLSESSALVASSSSRIGASRRMARAIATRWRWPPDSLIPRSPTIVSRPFGQRLGELGDVCRLCRTVDLGVAGTRFCERAVVAQRSVVHGWELWHV